MLHGLLGMFNEVINPGGFWATCMSKKPLQTTLEIPGAPLLPCHDTLAGSESGVLKGQKPYPSPTTANHETQDPISPLGPAVPPHTPEVTSYTTRKSASTATS
ncbi:hypothetical protein PCASD_24204 [Puccinia coronata f. sp. avenae]|uniref:Uncharacterized protein n=1 Tax=Puccinia coronata f. sp. avenae TaxID=200324 RepID=A0A2N5SC75_9BASI|nr:hypothetical protein PCASD_24923 [Puccinia coronata f. sp. avenae]PLW27422.1 hypothetical protein PCASD_24204 [Puccinia coronata f. sp. avenae]